MRQSTGGIAVICRDRDGVAYWLAQWNGGWKAMQLVGGHKRRHESYRECVIREITEELRLEAEQDFAVADEPRCQISYIAPSRSSQEDTLYSMELFDVQLCARAEAKIDESPLNRWLTEAEIREQRCEDGTPVSSTMQLMLNQVGRSH